MKHKDMASNLTNLNRSENVTRSFKTQENRVLDNILSNQELHNYN